MGLGSLFGTQRVTGQQVQQWADQVPVLSRVAKRALQVHCVLVTPPNPGVGNVASGLQITHDRLHGAFGHPDHLGQVPHPGIRVLGDRHQRTSVRGQQSPTALLLSRRHTLSIYTRVPTHE